MQMIVKFKVRYTDKHDGREVERSFQVPVLAGLAPVMMVNRVKEQLNKLHELEPHRPEMTVLGWSCDHVMTVKDVINEIRQHRM